MGCVFCRRQEKSASPPDTVEWMVCSVCVQRLLMASQEEKLKVYKKAIELGFSNKASALESFMEELPNDETGKIRSNMERKRPMRKTRLARYEIRA
ncbi:MAG: hypothetical protein ABIF87_01965 [Pseudomonadota bacterium]